jgi:hypothetical protein
MDKINLSFYI